MNGQDPGTAFTSQIKGCLHVAVRLKATRSNYLKAWLLGTDIPFETISLLNCLGSQLPTFRNGFAAGKSLYQTLASRRAILLTKL